VLILDVVSWLYVPFAQGGVINGPSHGLTDGNGYPLRAGEVIEEKASPVREREALSKRCQTIKRTCFLASPLTSSFSYPCGSALVVLFKFLPIAAILCEKIRWQDCRIQSIDAFEHRCRSQLLSQRRHPAYGAEKFGEVNKNIPSSKK